MIHYPIEPTIRNAALDKRFIVTTSTFSGGVVSMVSINTTALTPIALIKNPSSNDKTLALDYFDFGLTSANLRAEIFLFIAPTVTSNGTALPVTSTNIKVSPVASLMEAYKSPTVSSFGSLGRTLYMAPNQNSQRFDFEGKTILNPGIIGLFAVQMSGVQAVNIHADLSWYEL